MRHVEGVAEICKDIHSGSTACSTRAVTSEFNGFRDVEADIEIIRSDFAILDDPWGPVVAHAIAVIVPTGGDRIAAAAACPDDRGQIHVQWQSGIDARVERV